MGVRLKDENEYEVAFKPAMETKAVLKKVHPCIICDETWNGKHQHVRGNPIERIECSYDWTCMKKQSS